MSTGIIMEIEGRFTYVFTNDCQLIRVRKNSSHFVGQQIAIKNSDRTAGDRLSQAFARIPAKGYALAAAAAVVIIIAAVLLATSPWQGNPAVTYMSVDINPSVELALDAEHRVVETRPLNPEAKTLLEHVSLDGLLYNKAIEAWVRTVRDVMPDKLDQVLISVLLDQTDDKFKASLMEMNGYQSSGELTGLDVWVLYSDDLEIRKQAVENNLSIGRQLLLGEALQQDLDWTATTIREASLASVLSSLLANGETKLLNPGNNSIVEATETTEPTTTKETTTKEPTETTVKPTTETTVKPTTETTVKPTTETTAKPTETTVKPTEANKTMDLKILANDANGIALSWTTAPAGSNFNYCKVVISEFNPELAYPASGYLTYFSDPATTNYTINNTKTYSGELHKDIADKTLVVGRQYYIRISYVYDGSTVYNSDVERVVYNGPAYVKPPKVTTGIVPDLTSYARDLTITSNDGNGIALAWTPPPAGTSFRYCKIIMSDITPEPVFPQNGYLTYYKDPSVSSYLINNTIDYTTNSEEINQNSKFKRMVVGKQYYIRIAYVYDDPTNTEYGFTVQYSNVQAAVFNGPEYVG
jgi:hypothetical protein